MNSPALLRAFRRAPARVLAVAAAMAGLASCATPGPLHVYSVASATAPAISDAGPPTTAEVPDFLAPGETLTGFAYDPFTDHFFLRLAPGNRIRVVDRPARAIKREFEVTQLRANGGGDLAIRPRDGHVFALVPGEAALVEFTRYGEFVGQVALEDLPGPPCGVAFDALQNRLLILVAGVPATIFFHAPNGRQLSRLSLDHAAGDWLAFDADRREIYAPLLGNKEVGVFGEDGNFRGRRPVAAAFVDVGPRSFLRMF